MGYGYVLMEPTATRFVSHFKTCLSDHGFRSIYCLCHSFRLNHTCELKSKHLHPDILSVPVRACAA